MWVEYQKCRTFDVCYDSGMAKTSSKELSAARRRMAELKRHYRGFLVTRDGKPYNPLLDDPDHSENRRRWAHGMTEGYNKAGCHCDPCENAGREENQRYTEKRIARRLDEHRAAAAEVLAAQFPGLPPRAIEAAAAKVVAIGKVVNKTTAKVAYAPAEVALALENWALRGGHVLDADVLDKLAGAITERLGS